MRGAPKVRPRNVRQTVARIWEYFGGERVRIVGVFGLVVVEAAFRILGPYLIGRAIDAMAALLGSGAADASALRGLQFPVLSLLAVYLGSGGATTLHGWVMAGVSQRMVRNVRRTLFAKLQRLPLSFFDLRTHGDLMSRVTNDVDAVSTTVSQSAVQLMSGVVVLTSTLTLMLILNPLLALAALVPVPLVILLAALITRVTRRLFKQRQQALGRLNGHVEETVTGIQAVKAFGREKMSVERFEKSNEQLRLAGTRAQILGGFLMPMMNVIGNLGFAAVAVVGGVMAARGTVSVGLIATFIGYSRQFARPLNEIANIYNTLMAAVAGAERVFDVLDEEEEPEDPPDALELTDPRGEVEFRNVSFGYRSDVPVLHGVSFHAAPGSVTAIVGRTGAGKTTIVNLLSRFYEVSELSLIHI